MVQLLVPGQSEPLRHRREALAPACPQQPAHTQRRQGAPRAAAGHGEEGFKPAVEVSVDIAWQGKGGSQLHA
jgi:hypothetical protein